MNEIVSKSNFLQSPVTISLCTYEKPSKKPGKKGPRYIISMAQTPLETAALQSQKVGHVGEKVEDVWGSFFAHCKELRIEWLDIKDKDVDPELAAYVIQIRKWEVISTVPLSGKPARALGDIKIKALIVRPGNMTDDFVKTLCQLVKQTLEDYLLTAGDAFTDEQWKIILADQPAHWKKYKVNGCSLSKTVQELLKDKNIVFERNGVNIKVVPDRLSKLEHSVGSRVEWIETVGKFSTFLKDLPPPLVPGLITYLQSLKNGKDPDPEHKS